MTTKYLDKLKNNKNVILLIKKVLYKGDKTPLYKIIYKTYKDALFGLCKKDGQWLYHEFLC